MATDTVTIAQFVKDNRISMTAEWADRNPHMDDSANMDHWKVTLRRGESGKSKKRYAMTTYFSQGYGHNGKEPKVTSVLDCLASDSSSIENARSFEDWANDFGYDTDSRKAEKTFKTCEHQAKRLKNFLGDDLYEQLLWHTERE